MTEYDRLRRGFAQGIVLVLAFFIVIAAVIHLANGSHHRPEGVAEQWLTAVSDTTRKGVHDESVARAEKVGPVALAKTLLADAGSTSGHRAFADLEVGKAVVAVGAGGGAGVIGARVPYHLHVYRKTGTEPVHDGVVLLEKAASGHGWRVTGLGPRLAGERVPSEGGRPPSSAPVGLWVAAVVAGFVITGLAVLAVRAASPPGSLPGSPPGSPPAPVPAAASPVH